ncbi:MAG: hypothetical protein IJH59_08760, partial [Firmicutes bacterium]|nr:hypothetical protein [Bacillota bacterium]
YKTIYPIKPSSFLKEYGAIQDENVFSISTILEKTREQINTDNCLKQELEGKKMFAAANAAFNQFTGVKRHKRF